MRDSDLLFHQDVGDLTDVHIVIILRGIEAFVHGRIDKVLRLNGLAAHLAAGDGDLRLAKIGSAV